MKQIAPFFQVSSFRENEAIWGPKKLSTGKTWCDREPGSDVDCMYACREGFEPFRLFVPEGGIPVRGAVNYHLYSCDQPRGDGPASIGALSNKRLKQEKLTVDDVERTFILAVIEANFDERWARFIVIELLSP